MNSVPLYDALAADYDRFVNWDGRLAHELPFLDQLFAQHGVHHILDAACGTGHHAIALGQRGHEVMGADLSAPMIRRAQENAAAAGVDATFVVAGLGELAAQGRTFDAALCLGNSLPHLLGASAVASAVSDFSAALRPGGLLLIQNRNFDRVWAERERFMDPQSYCTGDDEWIFVRFYDFHQETITFNMITLRRRGEAWTQEVEATELRPILRDELAEVLAQAGFGAVTFYGGYDGSAFDPARSRDLVAIAERTH